MRRRIRPSIRNEDDLASLCRKGTQEFLCLDYKRKANLEKNNRKRVKKDPHFEMRKDVTAFANAIGGVLLYGVDETDEVNNTTPKVLGIADGPRVEEQIRDILADKISPTLRGVAVRRIDLSNSKSVVVIEVPSREQGQIFSVTSEEGPRTFLRVDKSNRELTNSDEIEHVRLCAPEMGYQPRPSVLVARLGCWSANSLTAMRPLLGLMTAYAIYKGLFLWATLLYLLGLLTDFLDGAIARLTKGTTEFGKEFDRWADMLFNACAVSGYALTMIWVRQEIARPIILMCLTAGMVVGSRPWIEPHSAFAKARSGIIRCFLIGFLLCELPLAQSVGVGVAGGIVLITVGVYEIHLLDNEVNSGVRPMRRWKELRKREKSDQDKSAAR